MSIQEGLMLKLKLQCFGHLMQRTDSLEKTLMLGKIEDQTLKSFVLPHQAERLVICSGRRILSTT